MERTIRINGEEFTIYTIEDGTWCVCTEWGLVVAEATTEEEAIEKVQKQKVQSH